jgi:hypothetical protein
VGARAQDVTTPFFALEQLHILAREHIHVWVRVPKLTTALCLKMQTNYVVPYDYFLLHASKIVFALQRSHAFEGQICSVSAANVCWMNFDDGPLTGLRWAGEKARFNGRRPSSNQHDTVVF